MVYRILSITVLSDMMIFLLKIFYEMGHFDGKLEGFSKGYEVSNKFNLELLKSILPPKP